MLQHMDTCTRRPWIAVEKKPKDYYQSSALLIHLA